MKTETKVEATPGPWVANIGEVGFERLGSAYGSHGCLITEANGKYGNIAIADVLMQAPDIGSGMANARLIAAAPELLAALEAMLSVYPAGGNGDAEDRHRVVELSKAAIKKARG